MPANAHKQPRLRSWRFHPGDGFHRIAAARRIGRDTILADVRAGDRRDAILHAAGANAAHGLRRSSADKRNAVLALLRDPEWRRWSDREIGKASGVDHKTVGRVRRELNGEIPADRNVTYRTRHGTLAERTVKPAEAPAAGTSFPGSASASRSPGPTIQRDHQIRVYPQHRHGPQAWPRDQAKMPSALYELPERIRSIFSPASELSFAWPVDSLGGRGAPSSAIQ